MADLLVIGCDKVELRRILEFFICVAAYPPGVLFPLGGFGGAVWREDPPRIRPSGLFPAAQKVLQ